MQSGSRHSTCTAPNIPIPWWVSSLLLSSLDTDEQSQRAQSAERQRGQRRRPAADLDAAVMAERDAPRREHVAQAGQQMTAGVEPEPEETHGDAGAEERSEHAASSSFPAEERHQASQQRHAGVDQRNPGPPGLAEHLAMFEAQLAEQERGAAEQGAGDALVAIDRRPACSQISNGHGNAHGLLLHGLTTISPAISSCPLPQKTSQWKGKVPALSGTMRSRVTLPGSMLSSIFRSGIWKPCLRSSVVSSSTTGSPSFSSMTAGVNLNLSAVTAMTLSCARAAAAPRVTASIIQ